MNHAPYNKNENGRDFIIGDLHGCYDLLMNKMDEFGFDKKVDRLFSVGDLIDRGPKSLECLKLITEPWFHPVQGNHEDMMVSAILDEQNINNWIYNGSDWYFKLSPEDRLLVTELCQQIKDTIPYSITIDDKIGICHAQPPSTDWLDAQNPEARDIDIMLWSRSWIQNKKQTPVESIEKTFHGHTPNKIVNIANTNFIDTGAFYTGELTFLQIIPAPNTEPP